MVAFSDTAFIAETARALDRCMITSDQIEAVMSDPAIASHPLTNDVDIAMRRKLIVKASLELFGGDVTKSEDAFFDVWINVRNVANGRPRVPCERIARASAVTVAAE